ncbi:unnamed protein product [Lactuca saligna]|uniref:Small auxin-up RNA n=1 Tax=Lactuca saligna TaxID=75948 RepID=A0AA35ZUZ8_LACSI|nr:unnamed protein product [Lactuca saligna]
MYGQNSLQKERQRHVILIPFPAYVTICHLIFHIPYGYINHKMNNITTNSHLFPKKSCLKNFHSPTTKSMDIPKGCLAVYVGEQEKKRFVVPVWLLMKPTFQQLLDQAEEEFGYSHPMGGLTIPCSEYMFTDLASRLGAL